MRFTMSIVKINHSGVTGQQKHLTEPPLVDGDTRGITPHTSLDRLQPFLRHMERLLHGNFMTNWFWPTAAL